jgi:AmiR/NasT family two-component response regulator
MGPSQSQKNTPTRILIVEDAGIIADHIASMLVKAGYEVAGIAESSEGVLKKVAESSTDLILMDIRIKGALDRIQTAAKLRGRFDIPIIDLTAHSDQKTVDRAKTTGAFGFLTKPIQPPSLAIAIEMAFYKHDAERAVRDQRAWMGTVLGTMADALAVIDRDGKLQFLNAPAEELTGWKHDDARDTEIALVLPLSEAASGLPANHVYSLCPDLTPRQLPPGMTATDTGACMSAEAAERLFEPFFAAREAGGGPTWGSRSFTARCWISAAPSARIAVRTLAPDSPSVFRALRNPTESGSRPLAALRLRLRSCRAGARVAVR